MEKRSSYGRRKQEEFWQNAEIDALSRLAGAGVRVPQTYGCFDGVLLMELITDEAGHVAPRLAEVTMSEEQAIEDHACMMHYLMLMLCAGIVLVIRNLSCFSLFKISLSLSLSLSTCC